MRSILQYQDLVDISVRDNGENLVVVQDRAPEIICDYKKTDMIAYVGDRMLLREDVVRRLKLAAANLQKKLPGAQLHMVYGYRHPEVQRAYFEKSKKIILERDSSIREPELTFKTHLLSASPDVAGHPTGGAFDITIQRDKTELDMGSDIADFSSPLIETFAAGLTPEQISNRALIREVLMKENFAPFDGEWWHFSYGDREWAAYYKKSFAIYDQKTFSL